MTWLAFNHIPSKLMLRVLRKGSLEGLGQESLRTGCVLFCSYGRFIQATGSILLLKDQCNSNVSYEGRHSSDIDRLNRDDRRRDCKTSFTCSSQRNELIDGSVGGQGESECGANDTSLTSLKISCTSTVPHMNAVAQSTKVDWDGRAITWQQDSEFKITSASGRLRYFSPLGKGI